MLHSESCVICPQGCATVELTPNGTCPLHWTRPDGSSLCSHSFSCLSNADNNSRIVGCFFILVSLVYLLILFHDRKKKAAVVNSRGDLQQTGTQNFTNRLISYLRGISPRTVASVFMFLAMMLRGLDSILLVVRKLDPTSNCPTCYPRDANMLLSDSVVFNMPLNLMMCAALIVLSFWIEIHVQCLKLTKSDSGSRSVAELLLCKQSMFVSAFIFSVLVIGSGYIHKLCQLSCPAGANLSYLIVIILWLLQYNVFCLFWGNRVMRSVSSVQGLALTGINGKSFLSDVSLLECIALTWKPIAAAMGLSICSRFDAAVFAPPLLARVSKSSSDTSSANSEKSSPDNVNGAAQSELMKLRTALARVRYVQFIAVSTVVLIVSFMVIGTLLGYYSGGADPNKYLAFMTVLRCIEMAYALGFSAFFC